MRIYCHKKNIIMNKKKLLFIASLIMGLNIFSQEKVSMPIVVLETTKGTITLQLYPETIKHSNNFLKLVNAGTYNGLLFHRVIADFMIQAGDPTSKNAKSDSQLGSGDVGYTIPAEFIYPKYYHKRGALAAARQGDETNPTKASSGCQFYIVHGRIITEPELKSIERVTERKLETKLFQKILSTKQAELKKYQLAKNQIKLDELHDSIMVIVRSEVKKDSTFRFTKEQRRDYTTIGGTPHLDGQYTVFGEVIEGLDIVTQISTTKTKEMDRPIEDVKILKARVVKK
jgi:peptidylprolyl isomerase